MKRKGEYGFDAPYVPIIAIIASVVTYIKGIYDNDLGLIITGAFFMLVALSFIYATRVGKFQVWDELLEQVDFKGDENILDMGCGRGAVLLMAAKYIPNGKAVGIDLWRSKDQSGNGEATTLQNAELEGVKDRIELNTGDMSAMPFGDDQFDVVLSSLAIHNIKDKDARAKAIGEAIRVLKPGGKLIIADVQSTRQYAQILEKSHMNDVIHKGLGWRTWFGGPWMSTIKVTATKPG